MTLVFSFISTVVACTAALAVHASGLWVAIGAHPNWSQSVTIIGSLIGISIFFSIRYATSKFPNSLKSVVFALVAAVILTFGMTTLGKREFVASYAENDLAGLFWFYGFIGFVTSLIAATAVGVGWALGKLKTK